MQLDPNRETVEEWTPEKGGVDKFNVGDLRIKVIDTETMSGAEFNALPKGEAMRVKVMAGGYDAVLIKTGQDINLGGDQLVVYRNFDKVSPTPEAPQRHP